MKKLLLSLLLSAGFFSVKGQTAFFAYFQTEDGFPFYIKMNEQVYRSGQNGSLTLANLADSTYALVVGIPSSTREFRYALRINGADQGFSIRDQDGEPVLVSLLNGVMLRPQRMELESDISFVRRTDAFSALLARATGDTTLMYQVVYAKAAMPAIKDTNTAVNPTATATSDVVVVKASETDVVKVESTVNAKDSGISITVIDSTQTESSAERMDSGRMADPLVRVDSAAMAGLDGRSDPVKDSVKYVKPHPVVDTTTATLPILENRNHTGQDNPFTRSVITRYAESSTSEGFGLVFIDQTPTGPDTIRLLIPNPRFVIQRTDTSDQHDESLFIKRKELDSLQKDKSLLVSSDTSQQRARSVVSQDCKTLASDNDFFKLRKAMASKETDEGMIDEARKMFRARCFTTRQIKNLGSLF